MSPILVFDIETVPDVRGIRLLGLAPADASDAEAIALAQAARKEQTGSDFLPLPLQRVVCISCVFRDVDSLKVHSFCDESPVNAAQAGNSNTRSDELGSGEAGVIQRFFRSIDKHTPQLVSWNGGGFDLPVLHYRGLQHGVRAPRYWEMGEAERDFRFNNYLNRYHMRHLDLMDLLALYQPRNNAALDTMAKLCGLPGKLGVDGSQVAGLWLDGRLDDIRNYCETDVVNTYLLYLRWRRFSGQLPSPQFEQEEAFVRSELTRLAAQAPHWQEYLSAWTTPSPLPATAATATTTTPTTTAPGSTSPRSI